jgi:hypothetical protein
MPSKYGFESEEDRQVRQQKYKEHLKMRFEQTTLPKVLDVVADWAATHGLPYSQPTDMTVDHEYEVPGTEGTILWFPWSDREKKYSASFERNLNYAEEHSETIFRAEFHRLEPLGKVIRKHADIDVSLRMRIGYRRKDWGQNYVEKSAIFW